MTQSHSQVKTQAVWLYFLLSSHLIGKMVLLSLTLLPCYVAREVMGPINTAPDSDSIKIFADKIGGKKTYPERKLTM